MKKYRYTVKQNLFYMISKLLTPLGCLQRLPRRPAGISMLIRVKNEADWIGMSLLSLQGFADEALIIDNGSSDDTLAAIRKVEGQLGFPVKITRNDTPDYCAISNQLLQQASYRWLFRWDGDFIAHTSGENNINRLREYLLGLPENRCYMIFPQTVSLAGDLYHVKHGYELHSEGYIVSYHPRLRFRQGKRFEVLHYPLYFRLKRLSRIFFIHIGTAKAYQKIRYRLFWLDWLRLWRGRPEIGFEEYLQEYAMKGNSSREGEELIRQKFNDIVIRQLRKYDIDEFGEYPELMRPVLKNPPFRVLYENGCPACRSDLQ